jgi:hypothetical protein
MANNRLAYGNAKKHGIKTDGIHIKPITAECTIVIKAYT